MKQLGFAAVVILAGAFARLLPHPPNFTPIAALALVGGAYLDRRFALVLPLVALIISDAVIGFHGLMAYVYVSFLMVGFIGSWIRKDRALHRMAAGTLGGSILFFLVTNFGVWFAGGGAFYPLTFSGLVECYVVALPFFRNSLAGDVIYATVLFTIFEYARRTYGLFEERVAHEIR